MLIFACMYALNAITLTYIPSLAYFANYSKASFLLKLMYFLPGLQFSDRAKFTIASLSSSAVVSGLVSLQAL